METSVFRLCRLYGMKGRFQKRESGRASKRDGRTAFSWQRDKRDRGDSEVRGQAVKYQANRINRETKGLGVIATDWSQINVLQNVKMILPIKYLFAFDFWGFLLYPKVNGRQFNQPPCGPGVLSQPFISLRLQKQTFNLSVPPQFSSYFIYSL